MKSPYFRISRYGRQDGQILVLFLLFSIVLLLFVGLGIDLGFAYITKARLSKALDAGALAAVANYSSTKTGQDAAIALARNTFLVNYGTNGMTGLSGGVQVQSVGSFSTDTSTGNIIFSNSASATINTFFIGLLPQWKTLTVGDTAVASRAPVLMTLVVDRTGSMDPKGTPVDCGNITAGGLYLPGAVTQFIDIFDETIDRAALVSFSVSSSNDVPMSASGGQFKQPIIDTLSRFNKSNLWQGSTCSVSGLTNALNIQNGASVTPNTVKVVVFFTDGRANMTTFRFNTTPATKPPGGIYFNFGGNDPSQPGCKGFADPGAFFWYTNTSETAQANVGPEAGCGGSWTAKLNGTNITASVFTNANGIAKAFCGSTITEDATNRCVLIANQMRASSNYVYAVGLTTAGIAFAPPTLTTLQQIANDPDSPTFDQTQPAGAAFLTTGQDLTEVFQQVAADIILRLVH